MKCPNAGLKEKRVQNKAFLLAEREQEKLYGGSEFLLNLGS